MENQATHNGENLFHLFTANDRAVSSVRSNKTTQVDIRVLAYGEQHELAPGLSIEAGRGAFDASLADLASGAEYAFCFGDGLHKGDLTQVLGNTKVPWGKPGSLKFYERSDVEKPGLYASVILPPTSAGKDIAYLLRSGIIWNASIGTWLEDVDYIDDRRAVITTGRINEVSLVTRGKFESSRAINLKNIEEMKAALETPATIEAQATQTTNAPFITEPAEIEDQEDMEMAENLMPDHTMESGEMDPTEMNMAEMGKMLAAVAEKMNKMMEMMATNTKMEASVKPSDPQPAGEKQVAPPITDAITHLRRQQ